MEIVLGWRRNPRFRAALVALTVVLTILLAAHPELRLLLPVVDSLGLDFLMVLLGSQVLAFARPMLIAVARGAWRSFVYLLGTTGPYIDGALAASRAR